MGMIIPCMFPQVWFVGRQVAVREEMQACLEYYGFPDWMPEEERSGPEQLIEFAGRCCYLSFDPKEQRPGGNAAYLEHLKQVGHGSVTEHAEYVFVIGDVSRALTHELVRHRAGFGFSMLSERFVDMLKWRRFVMPREIQNRPWLVQLWTEGCQKALMQYQEMREELDKSIPKAPLVGGSEENRAKSMELWRNRRKRINETARCILPECTASLITVSGNARAWRNLLDLRPRPEAAAEFAEVAVAVWKLLVDESPNIFGDYRMNETEKGTFLESPYRKI